MSQEKQIENLTALARRLRLRRLQAGSIAVEPLYDDDGEDNEIQDVVDLLTERSDARS